MPVIHIGNIVTFAPNIGVLVHRAALDISPKRLLEAVRLAYSHMKDELLCDACCSDRGPLAQYHELRYDEYIELLEKIRIAEAAKKARQSHTKIRRSSFNAKRSQLVLAMIESGAPYVCGIPGCNLTEDLTIDHITPLSRGGTDDLSNLRFLCHYHNSVRGDGLGAK